MAAKRLKTRKTFEPQRTQRAQSKKEFFAFSALRLKTLDLDR